MLPQRQTLFKEALPVLGFSLKLDMLFLLLALQAGEVHQRTLATGALPAEQLALHKPKGGE
jgi:hypothetical protein